MIKLNTIIAYRFFIISALVVLSSGYNALDQLYAGDDKKPVVETMLDTLNRGKEVLLTDKDITSIVPESTSVVVPMPEVPVGKVEFPNGFRVQCFASSQIERIRAEQKVLESKINFPVYIVATPPYYKLHFGDFVKRSDADLALAKAKELGYTDAWVTRSKIWAPR
jgi:hypothetical protein